MKTPLVVSVELASEPEHFYTNNSFWKLVLFVTTSVVGLVTLLGVRPDNRDIGI